MAIASVTAKSAVGGSGRPRRLRVASVAASTPISVRRTSAGSWRDRARRERFPVALERLGAEGVAHLRAEKRDPPMAEPDEMLGREAGPRLVVGHHGREVRPGHVVVDEDHREAAVPEAHEESGVERAHHQRPIDGAVAQHPAHVGLAGPFGRRRSEDETVPSRLGHLRHPAEHDPIEGVAEDGGDVPALKHGHALGAPAGQAAAAQRSARTGASPRPGRRARGSWRAPDLDR